MRWEEQVMSEAAPMFFGVDRAFDCFDESEKLSVESLYHIGKDGVGVEASDGLTYEIGFDGLQGELTRQNWKDCDEVLELFDSDSQDTILDYMEVTYNGNFFAHE